MKIHEVYSVTAMQDAALIIDMDCTGLGGRIRTKIVYRHSDPYGDLTPLITQCLTDNPEQEILPYISSPELTPEELRALMPRKTMVEFRIALRSVKVVPREGEAELDGIYETDILEKISLIADRALQAEARDYFLYAGYVDRSNPWVDILGAMFGLLPEKIDGAWVIVR